MINYRMEVVKEMARVERTWFSLVVFTCRKRRVILCNEFYSKFTRKE